MKQTKNIFLGLLYQVLCIGVVFSLSSCGDDKEIDKLIDNGSIIAEKNLAFSSGGGIKSLEITTTEIDPSSLTYSVSSNGSTWCEVKEKEGKLTLEVKTNNGAKRLTILTLLAANGVRQDVTISQTEFRYPSGISADIQILASSAKVLGGNEIIPLTMDENGNMIPQTDHKDYHPAKHAVDGDVKTFYHSEFQSISAHANLEKRWPIIIEVDFEKPVEKIDYLNIVPRSDTGTRWGMVGKFNLLVSTTDKPEFTRINETPFDAGQKDMITYKVNLTNALQNVKAIQLEILDGFNDRSSLAEIEFFALNTDTELQFDPLTIFANASCSEIKTGVTKEDIINIPEAFYKNIATGILDGTYQGKEYRIQEYRPYEYPKHAKARNKILHEWGFMDNITGIYVDNINEPLLVFVGDTHGQNVILLIQDYKGKWQTRKIGLQEGLNSIKSDTRGLCYILLQSDIAYPLNPKTEADKAAIKAKSINIHFATGKVNGYFDASKHKETDAAKILENAGYEYIDIRGDYALLTWYTKHFRDNPKSSLAISCAHVNELVRLEQEISGLIEYKKEFTTRMFMMPSSNGGGDANATATRTIFPESYNGRFATDRESMIKSVWGPAHEVGHCSQLNPAFRWGGMGEVGNNLFSMYVKTQMAGLSQSNLLLEGYYPKARASIIEANIPHCDAKQLMEKLVPIWQVQLYLAEVKGYKNFHKDLFEYFRTTPDIGTTFLNSGPLQLDYIRQVCRIGKVNLVDFFQKWGFLTPVDRVMNDYGNRTLKITQADVDKLIAEINAMGHPIPGKDVTLIQDDNIAEFK